MGWATARLVSVPSWISQPAAWLASLAWIYYHLASLIILRRPDADRYVEMFHRARRWIEALAAGGTVEDPLLFIAFLSLSLWLIAYVGTWTLVRARWVWPSIVPGATVILINMIYSAKDLRSFLALYLLLGLVLLAVSHVQNLGSRWHLMGARYSDSVTRRIVLWALVLSVSLLAVTWSLPSGTLELDPGSIWQALTSPWNQIQDRVGRILTSAVRGGRSEYSSFGPNFDIGGPVRLSDRPVMVVHSDKPSYWAVAVYDQYTGQGWRSSVLPNDVEGIPGEQPLLLSGNQLLPSELQDRATVTQSITILEPRSGYLPLATVPMGFDRDVLLQVPWITTTYTLELGTPGQELSQPELKPLAIVLQQWSLRARSDERVRDRALVKDGTIRDPDTILASLPWSRPTLRTIAGSIRAAWQSMAQRGVDIEVTMEGGVPQRLVASGRFPVLYDVRAAAPASGSISSGYTYTVVSSIPIASPDKLRSVAADYPDWVKDKYLQLPSELPQRVRDLALQVTQGASNQYDKAKAVEQFLRQYTYNENVPFVPRNRDAVDYFLFDIKQGYCTSYASAMVVMLRSVGIPARMVTGFTTGTYDEAQNGYVVLDSNAHAWPEVYFPGYGWVPFEPTSSRPPIQLGDAETLSTGEGDTGPSSGTAASSGRRLIPDEGVNDTDFSPNTIAPLGLAGGQPFAVTLLTAAIAVITLGAWLLWNRLFRGLTTAAAAYHKAMTLARMAGAVWPEGSTPLERAAYMARVAPHASGHLLALAEAYSTEVYGSLRPRTSAQTLIAYWRRVRAVLLAQILLRPLRTISGVLRRLTVHGALGH